MDKLSPKFRKPLNYNQKEILLLLYKFRFATQELLVKCQNQKSSRYTHTRLQILLEQAYIGRNYDNNYRLAGRAANYYLLTKGIRLLKKKEELNLNALNGMYKNKTASDVFIERKLCMLKFYLKFRQLYPKLSDFYTKSELSEYSFFPNPTPDSYLRFNPNSPTYMLDYIHTGMPLYSVKKLIVRYPYHYDEDGWHNLSKDYPKLLFVCDNSAIEKQVQRQVNEIGISDLEAYTTSIKALLNSQSQKDKIWKDVFEPEKLIILSGLE